MNPYKIVILKICDSTQEELKRILAGNEQDLLAVLAFEQYKGKGNYGRTWISNEGGLYLSFNYPLFIHKTIPVSIIFSVLIIKSLLNYIPQLENHLGLIFPNDIVIEYNNIYYKLGGVLVETYKHYYIVGVGINISNRIINQKLEHKAISLLEFFDEFLKNNSKLDIELSKNLNIIDLAKLILSNLRNISFDIHEIEKIDFTNKLSNIDVVLFSDGEEIQNKFDKIKILYHTQKIVLYKDRMRKEYELTEIKRIFY